MALEKPHDSSLAGLFHHLRKSHRDGRIFHFPVDRGAWPALFNRLHSASSASVLHGLRSVISAEVILVQNEKWQVRLVSHDFAVQSSSSSSSSRLFFFSSGRSS